MVPPRHHTSCSTACRLLTTSFFLSTASLLPVVDGFLIPTTNRDSFHRITLASPRRPDSSALSAGSVDDNNDSFMKSVRSIQDNFYSSDKESGQGDNCGHPFLDRTTGLMRNLPILVSPSTELPGRQTVRFIDNPLDIHMLESSLRRSSEIAKGDRSFYCYVGQLYRDPNNGKDENPLKRQKIKSWNDFTLDANNADDNTCVGTLLRIMDFKRFTDGRMVLLVQGVERFAIDEIRQEFPYTIVNAQILPDEEELSDFPSISSAVAASFAWHSLEYQENVALTDNGRVGEEVSIELIVGERLSQLIPFVPFNSAMSEKALNSLQETIAQAITCIGTASSANISHLPSMSDFTSRNVLSNVSTYTNLVAQSEVLTADAIEYDLWLCVDEYFRLQSLQELIPPNLIALLPRRNDWPDDFCLEEIALDLIALEEAKSTKKHGEPKRQFVRIGHLLHYPNERRLRRLSYSASALLGGSTPTALLNKGVRQTLLEIPSTRGRLWAVLERFVEYNSLLRSKHTD